MYCFIATYAPLSPYFCPQRNSVLVRLWLAQRSWSKMCGWVKIWTRNSFKQLYIPFWIWHIAHLVNHPHPSSFFAINCCQHFDSRTWQDSRDLCSPLRTIMRMDLVQLCFSICTGGRKRPGKSGLVRLVQIFWRQLP